MRSRIPFRSPATCVIGLTGVEDAFAAASLACGAVIGLTSALTGWARSIGAAPGIFVFEVLQRVHAGACFTSGGIVDEGKARPMTGWLTKAINQRTVATGDAALYIAGEDRHE